MKSKGNIPVHKSACTTHCQHVFWS